MIIVQSLSKSGAIGTMGLAVVRAGAVGGWGRDARVVEIREGEVS
jgi:hypothetical protein